MVRAMPGSECQHHMVCHALLGGSCRLPSTSVVPRGFLTLQRQSSTKPLGPYIG